MINQAVETYTFVLEMYLIIREVLASVSYLVASLLRLMENVKSLMIHFLLIIKLNFPGCII